MPLTAHRTAAASSSRDKVAEGILRMPLVDVLLHRSSAGWRDYSAEDEFEKRGLLTMPRPSDWGQVVDLKARVVAGTGTCVHRIIP